MTEDEKVETRLNARKLRLDLMQVLSSFLFEFRVNITKEKEVESRLNASSKFRSI